MSNNPILRSFAESRQPVGLVQDERGRTYQVPMQGQGLGPAFGPTRTDVAGTMTLDDVLVKSMCTIGLVMMVAAATFMLLPNLALASAAAGVGSLVGFVTAMVVGMRRNVGAVGALFYAVVEGVFLGGFTRVFEAYYPGIAVQAVIATFVAAGLTLLAYRTFKIKVGARLRRGVMIATMAFAAAMLLNFVLGLFGINLGLYDGLGQVSVLGVLVTLVGTGLAVFSLITDFDDINRGIAAGAPASESWRAAFGLTVTMVWLYVNLLRILSYLRRD